MESYLSSSYIFPAEIKVKENPYSSLIKMCMPAIVQNAMATAADCKNVASAKAQNVSELVKNVNDLEGENEEIRSEVKRLDQL